MLFFALPCVREGFVCTRSIIPLSYVILFYQSENWLIFSSFLGPTRAASLCISRLNLALSRRNIIFGQSTLGGRLSSRFIKNKQTGWRRGYFLASPCRMVWYAHSVFRGEQGFISTAAFILFLFLFERSRSVEKGSGCVATAEMHSILCSLYRKKLFLCICFCSWCALCSVMEKSSAGSIEEFQSRFEWQRTLGEWASDSIDVPWSNSLSLSPNRAKYKKRKMH